MSDVEIATNEAPAQNTLRIPVVKAKGYVIDGKAADHIEVELSKVPNDMYELALAQGLKDIINGGATKIKKEDYKTDNEYRAEAMKTARERLEMVYEGKIKKSRSATATPEFEGYDAPIITEARRIAKEIVKSQIKAMGKSVTRCDPSQITMWANEVLKSHPYLFKKAQENLEARKAPKIEGLKIEVEESPKRIAELAEKKAAKKSTTKPASAGQLSAAKAKKSVPLHAMH